jgi:hypothetical protein
LAKLDEEEKTIKSKADVYNKLLQSDDSRLTEDGLYHRNFFNQKNLVGF